MKRRSKSLTFRPGPVQLYLDEIETIAAILQRASDRITIRTDEYELESVDQLRDMKVERVGSLYLSTTSPYITVDLDRMSTLLFAGGDDPATRGVFEAIKDVLIKRRLPLARLLSQPFVGGILLMIGPYTGNLLGPPLGGFLPWITVILGVLMLTVTVRRAFFRHATIYVVHRADKLSFLRRNADQIWIALISAVLGGVVTLIAERLLRR